MAALSDITIKFDEEQLAVLKSLPEVGARLARHELALSYLLGKIQCDCGEKSGSRINVVHDGCPWQIAVDIAHGIGGLPADIK